MNANEPMMRVLATIQPELRDRFGVSSMGIFGSAARGELRPESDIDVLVSFRPDARVTLFTLAALASRLELALGRPVDLVEDHAGLRASFRAAIAKDLRHVA